MPGRIDGGPFGTESGRSLEPQIYAIFDPARSDETIVRWRSTGVEVVPAPVRTVRDLSI